MNTSSVARTDQDFRVEPFICVLPVVQPKLGLSQTLGARGHEVMAVT
jgi:hypothetical protein